jgi:glycogen debranching enzyme
VVEVCARKLWTSHGLRSLAPDDPQYAGRYLGEFRYRDSIYHQGTGWSWLAGAFISAHLRVYGDVAAARSYLDSLLGHVAGGCIGSISEIFDGDAPFTPRGAYAQAWGVAEILRAWAEITALSH